ncbi:hypothetical protein ACOMHN_057827 [Nucella lapillus]
MNLYDRGCSGSVLPLHTGVKGLDSKGHAPESETKTDVTQSLEAGTFVTESETKTDVTQRLDAGTFVTDLSFSQEAKDRSEAFGKKKIVPEGTDIQQLDRAQPDWSIRQEATDGTETPERDDVHQLDRAQDTGLLHQSAGNTGGK